MDNEKEISFGAFDSELMRQEIFIPEGFTATIEGDKIILKKIESEDERIRKLLVEAVTQVLQDQYCSNRGVSKEKVVACLASTRHNILIFLIHLDVSVVLHFDARFLQHFHHFLT